MLAKQIWFVYIWRQILRYLTIETKIADKTGKKEERICTSQPNINTDTTMVLFREHFVGILIILLVTFSLSTATIQRVMMRFTEKKRVATSHTTIQNISDIQCVRKCNKKRQTGGCTLAGYDKATETCYLSIDGPQDVLDTTDEMAGVFVFFDLDPTGMYCMIYFKCIMLIEEATRKYVALKLKRWCIWMCIIYSQTSLKLLLLCITKRFS